MYVPTDVDECAVRRGGCPGHQICDNFPGGSRCICEPGTFLSNDSSKCTSSGTVSAECTALCLVTYHVMGIYVMS